MELSLPKYKLDTFAANKDILRFSHQAMATVFEIYISDEDETYAAQAAASAFNELDRLENELSYFRNNSDISRINNLSQNELITIGLDAFDCLNQCMRLYQQTKGAFDISMRPLFELWKKYDDPEIKPDKNEIVMTKVQIGLPWLQIIEDTHQVCLMSKSIQIDLGGFGKGYAIDMLKIHLDDWDIRGGLIHSGHSTVSPFGKNPEPMKWPLSISDPNNPEIILRKMDLIQGALSGSGLKKGQHIIDPRSGNQVKNNQAAWAYAPMAGDADALSTTFMVMNVEEIESYCEKYAVSGLTIENDSNNSINYYGEWA
jgi:thiamine biosynthesis lipoprotein